MGFEPAEMVECPGCKRTNAPNRPKCLYCGSVLPGTSGPGGNVKLSFRPLDAWEKGHNVVLMPGERTLSDDAVLEIANVLPLGPELIRDALNRPLSLPLARVETEAESEFISERFRAYSIETRTVGDEDLRVDRMPTRLRSLEFRDERILASMFNANETVEVPAADIELVVSGVVISTIADSVENKKIRRPGKVESTETAADEFIIDIYSRGDEQGWRIPGRGFDFSCLGDEKSLSSTENSKRLLRWLQRECTAAKFCDDYNSLRYILDICWTPETERSAAGFNRQGFGGVEVARRVVYDRKTQFTKYSRMLRAML